MTCCFQILPNPNIHYAHALQMLAERELRCMLLSLGISAEVRLQTIGNADFLVFDADVGESDLNVLASHSSLLLMCEKQGELLRPLPVTRKDYLPRDLAEVLKYKGKTGTAFTRMMISLALSASGQLRRADGAVLLDPMCGRGTGLYCALERGMNGIGMDTDREDLREALNYLSRYLTRARLKHELKQSSLTCGRESVPQAVYTLAADAAAYKRGDTRTLRFLQGDSSLCGPLLRKQPADVLTADLPYGIQHAPQAGRQAESFERALSRLLPSWHDALRPGGAAVLGFNTLTLPRKQLAALMAKAGFTVLEEDPYGPMEHFVEQAVTRDVIAALRS